MRERIRGVTAFREPTLSAESQSEYDLPAMPLRRKYAEISSAIQFHPS